MNRILRSVFVWMLMALLVLDTAGCSREWRRKFLRRSKNVAQAQPVLVLQSDVQAALAADVRYREHYTYWKSWHSDLVDSFGQSRRRDLKYLSGTIGELRAIAALLSGPPAQRMKEILIELSTLEEAWRRSVGPWESAAATRTRLEQLKREIDKDFHYAKVKKWIPPAKTP